MKKLTLFSLLFCTIFAALMLGGCSSKPFFVFSTQNPAQGIKQENLSVLFKKDERIYYALISPKGFKEKYVKIQLTKKDTKSEFWGFSNYRNKTVYVGDKDYYCDYFVIRENGIYVIMAYELKNLQKPIAVGSFKIDD